MTTKFLFGTCDCTVCGTCDCTVCGTCDCTVCGTCDCTVCGIYDYTGCGTCDCTVDSDVITGDFLQVLGILYVCENAHVRSYVSLGINWNEYSHNLLIIYNHTEQKL